MRFLIRSVSESWPLCSVRKVEQLLDNWWRRDGSRDLDEKRLRSREELIRVHVAAQLVYDLENLAEKHFVSFYVFTFRKLPVAKLLVHNFVSFQVQNSRGDEKMEICAGSTKPG